MTRRVVLHVGAPKSGTTYLQDRFRLNAALLTEQGITYVPTRHGTHFRAALDLIQRPWGGELRTARGSWQELVTEAGRIRGDVLVSHEILAGATPEQVARAMADFAGEEVHVLYTVRDLGRQVPAEWQESIKHRSKTTFARFLSQVTTARRDNPELWFWRVQGLPDVLTRWGNGLPPEQVHVVTVPPHGADRSLLWQRVCQVVGLDPDREYADSASVNSSIGTAEASVIRRLNGKLPPKVLARDDYVDLVRHLVVRDTLSHREDMVRASVPEEARPFFDEVATEWADWLLGSRVDVVGDAAELMPVWTPQDGRATDRPPANKVADAALEALAAMILEAARRDEPNQETPSVARRVSRRVLGS